MSLFNRKRRDEDGDHVRLTSADHSWWTGEEPVPDREDGTDAESSSFAPDYVDQPPPPGVAGLTDTVDEVYLDDPDASGSELRSGFAQALSDYGFGGDPVAADFDQMGEGPGEGFRPGDDGFASDWATAETDDDLAREVVERSLFVRDGLPAEDRLTELLGALGLEGDADWVDIARSHRRLVTAGTIARPEWEQDRQRRTANEAYACLRLFHH